MQVLTCTKIAGLLRQAALTEVSFVVESAAGGDPAVAIDAEAPVYPASMVKTPLAAAALSEVSAGRLTLSRQWEVTAANLTVNDAASPLVPGYAATLQELIELAITRSDNVATNMLFDIVGRERASEVARTVLGLGATAFHRKLSGADPLIDDPGWDGLHRNAHPASDAALLFGAIARREIPYAAELEAILDRQAWNDKLSAGLAPGDRFAHKTGDTSEVTHDGGILTTAEGRRYILVLYTRMPSSPENDTRFAAFMRLLRPYL